MEKLTTEESCTLRYYIGAKLEEMENFGEDNCRDYEVLTSILAKLD